MNATHHLIGVKCVKLEVYVRNNHDWMFQVMWLVLTNQSRVPCYSRLFEICLWNRLFLLKEWLPPFEFLSRSLCWFWMFPWKMSVCRWVFSSRNMKNYFKPCVAETFYWHPSLCCVASYPHRRRLHQGVFHFWSSLNSCGLSSAPQGGAINS